MKGKKAHGHSKFDAKVTADLTADESLNDDRTKKPHDSRHE